LEEAAATVAQAAVKKRYEKTITSGVSRIAVGEARRKSDAEWLALGAI
jgi:hypothetical protein